MKRIFIFFVFLSSLYFCYSYSVEVNKEKFLYMIQKEIINTHENKNNLYDSFDIYTFYYLNGKISGILEATRIVEQCEVTNQCIP